MRNVAERFHDILDWRAREQSLERILQKLTILRIETVFATTLPDSLCVAWAAALTGTENPHRFIRGTLGELVGIAMLIAAEQLAFGTIEPAPAGKPFPIIPFARARSGEGDFVVLEVATNRVVTCRRGIETPGRVFEGVESWLATRRGERAKTANERRV